jgi:hypothetical protein
MAYITPLLSLSSFSHQPSAQQQVSNTSKLLHIRFHKPHIRFFDPTIHKFKMKASTILALFGAAVFVHAAPGSSYGNAPAPAPASYSGGDDDSSDSPAAASPGEYPFSSKDGPPSLI